MRPYLPFLPCCFKEARVSTGFPFLFLQRELESMLISSPPPKLLKASLPMAYSSLPQGRHLSLFSPFFITRTFFCFHFFSLPSLAVNQNNHVIGPSLVPMGYKRMLAPPLLPSFGRPFLVVGPFVFT